jgi:hypothetical protein
MFSKMKKELIQTSVHRNGINIAVKTRVGGINSGTLANRNHQTRQPCGPCDSFRERTFLYHSQKGFDHFHQPLAELLYSKDIKSYLEKECVTYH